MIYALEELGIKMGIVSSVCGKLPFYSFGMGWVTVAVVVMVLCLAANKIFNSCTVTSSDKTMA